MLSDYDDLVNARKCIHVKLMSSTHAALRIEMFKLKLSMQEVFEELAQRIALNDPIILDILNELKQQKKNKKLKQLSKLDASSIYDIIENVDNGQE